MCIIRDDTEACIGRVFLHYTSECHLSHRCHSIGFIQNNKFEGSERWRPFKTFQRRGKNLPCAFGLPQQLICTFYLQSEGHGLANVFICSRTTSIPRSSLAFSSKTIWRMFLLPYMRLASARIVDVLPVPGGPYRRR